MVPIDKEMRVRGILSWSEGNRKNWGTVKVNNLIWPSCHSRCVKLFSLGLSSSGKKPGT